MKKWRKKSICILLMAAMLLFMPAEVYAAGESDLPGTQGSGEAQPTSENPEEKQEPQAEEPKKDGEEPADSGEPGKESQPSGEDAQPSEEAQEPSGEEPKKDDETKEPEVKQPETKNGMLTPVIKSAKAVSYKEIHLKWSKVKGADGYLIYRSKKEKKGYKKIADVKKASITTYKSRKLSSETTYYYKIKAYYKKGKKKYYSLESLPVARTTKKIEGGWKYVNGYKLFYDEKGKLVTDVSDLIGKQTSYVIKVNKKKNCVTVYAKDGKNGYIIPVKAFACSAGKATPITTARTPQKYRWHRLNGNCYGQWCTRIKQGFLFHSVMYGKPKNSTLSVSAYNKLGSTASHGCIRLTAASAKWIYDNCKLKTKVVIYNSSNPGPLGKPKTIKLKKGHKWDPTDPTAAHKCKERGCH